MFIRGAFILMGCFIMVNANPRPFYVDCIDSFECDRAHCCVIGMGRYSIPTCQPSVDIGESCRPDNHPTSINITYPDDTTVSLSNVYYIKCPCLPGLSCSENSETCEDQANTENFNNIFYY